MPVGKIFPPSRELIAVDFPLLVRPKNATFVKEYFVCNNLTPRTFMWSLVRTSLMPATF